MDTYIVQTVDLVNTGSDYLEPIQQWNYETGYSYSVKAESPEHAESIVMDIQNQFPHHTSDKRKWGSKKIKVKCSQQTNSYSYPDKRTVTKTEWENSLKKEGSLHEKFSRSNLIEISFIEGE